MTASCEVTLSPVTPKGRPRPAHRAARACRRGAARREGPKDKTALRCYAVTSCDGVTLHDMPALLLPRPIPRHALLAAVRHRNSPMQVEIVAGDHEPELPLTIVDRQGRHVDIAEIGEYCDTGARPSRTCSGMHPGGAIPLGEGVWRGLAPASRLDGRPSPPCTMQVLLTHR